MIEVVRADITTLAVDAIVNAANAALRGGLTEDTIADVERILGRVEAAIRARAISAT